MHRPFIMTLIVIAGGVAVPTLACAENPPAAIDSIDLGTVAMRAGGDKR
jgi:hypothetical protein